MYAIIQSYITIYRYIYTGASIPMGQGGHVPPNIYEGGDIHGNVPPNILEVMLFRMSARVTATVVWCILMQILCVVSQKSFSFWGTSIPQTPSLPLCPPNNPVRSTPLYLYIKIHVYRYKVG